MNRATASAFANWVFDVTYKRNSLVDETDDWLATRSFRMQMGAITHRDIELFLMHSWTKEFLGNKNTSGWELEFVDNKARPDRTFVSSKLLVDDCPLKCVPDVVLSKNSGNELLIIERKTTFVPEPYIPRNGWPNVEAQLWCYSWIDEFVSARKVWLVGQLWHRSRGGVAMCHRHPAWVRSEREHENRCRQLFKGYGGIVLSE